MVISWEMSFVTNACEDYIKSTPDLDMAHDEVTETSYRNSRSDYLALSVSHRMCTG